LKLGESLLEAIITMIWGIIFGLVLGSGGMRQRLGIEAALKPHISGFIEPDLFKRALISESPSNSNRSAQNIGAAQCLRSFWPPAVYPDHCQPWQ
jgi:hypothetical protein